MTNIGTLTNITSSTMPANISASAHAVLDNGVARSGTYALTNTVPTDSPQPYALFTSTDGNSGNAALTASLRWVSANKGAAGESIILDLHNSADNGVTNDYEMVFHNPSASTASQRGITIAKHVSGTYTELTDVSGGGFNYGSAFASDRWYNFVFTCYGGSLYVQCQDDVTKLYLTTDGTFDASAPGYCLTVADSSLTGAGYGGVLWFSSTSSDSKYAYADDLSFDTVAAAPAAATPSAAAATAAQATAIAAQVTNVQTTVTAIQTALITPSSPLTCADMGLTDAQTNAVMGTTGSGTAAATYWGPFHVALVNSVKAAPSAGGIG